uniref:Uncharacterized protein n=1 Tax=Lepeophtheirus salmonis TaxID=72036 RepID=A0A0K2VKF6_LEPSM
MLRWLEIVSGSKGYKRYPMVRSLRVH